MFWEKTLADALEHGTFVSSYIFRADLLSANEIINLENVNGDTATRRMTCEYALVREQKTPNTTQNGYTKKNNHKTATGLRWRDIGCMNTKQV